MIREPLPEILYKNLKKNGLPMLSKPNLLKIAERYNLFEDILPPFNSKVVLIGYVIKAVS